MASRSLSLPQVPLYPLHCTSIQSFPQIPSTHQPLASPSHTTSIAPLEPPMADNGPSPYPPTPHAYQVLPLPLAHHHHHHSRFIHQPFQILSVYQDESFCNTECKPSQRRPPSKVEIWLYVAGTPAFPSERLKTFNISRKAPDLTHRNEPRRTVCHLPSAFQSHVVFSRKALLLRPPSRLFHRSDGLG